MNGSGFMAADSTAPRSNLSSRSSLRRTRNKRAALKHSSFCMSKEGKASMLAKRKGEDADDEDEEEHVNPIGSPLRRSPARRARPRGNE